MGSLCSLWGLLLFAVLFSLELSWGEEEKELGALAGTPPMPLIQELMEQAPTAWPQGRLKKMTGGQPLRYMLNLYRSFADHNGRPRQDYRLDTNAVRLVRPSGKRKQSGASPWRTQTLDYHLKVHPEVEHLVKVAVVYSETLSTAHAQVLCTVELSRKDGDPKLPLNPVLPQRDTRNNTILPRKNGWVEMDITSHLQPWAWDTKKSQLLSLSHMCTRLGLEGGWDGTVSLNDPFLLLYLNDTRKGLQAKLGKASSEETPSGTVRTRKVRQAGNIVLDLPSYLQKNSNEKDECSLHSFRVSFAQLGWDHWIIAPHRYNPKYCKGNCPRILRYGYNSPNHAIVQNFINELVDQSVPRPSCVPYKYSPISVLMIEQNGSILYKEYEDMIAESCTCR
ncbi:bone morphogenetic protein 15 [Alligator mississippiensis]|nr:bone morphogenetic protein 15 [Alligator mississippiensis]